MTCGITSGQRDQIAGLATAATRKVVDAMGLDKEAAQCVITHGDEFAVVVGDAVRAAVQRLSVPQDFTTEQVASSWVYPPEYKGPVAIREQIDGLVQAFGLSGAEALRFAEAVLPTLVLPEGAEGWFAIPKVEGLARLHFPSIMDPAARYCAAVRLTLGKIAEQRAFKNWREGQVVPAQLRQHARTAAMLERIGEQQQPGDIILLPAQFGRRHAGRSVRRARAVFSAPEFGLGSLAVGSMTLTHSQRFVRWEQLHADCSGDEFAGGGSHFVRAPYFGWHDGELHFGTYPYSGAVDNYGSVSGFLPQS